MAALLDAKRLRSSLRGASRINERIHLHNDDSKVIRMPPPAGGTHVRSGLSSGVVVGGSRPPWEKPRCCPHLSLLT